ncbi:MAG: HAMP domain-containing protein [Chloroflexi bacterium]|nr:HAMP domain-containing protein [Chloroflexota bacterium]
MRSSLRGQITTIMLGLSIGPLILSGVLLIWLSFNAQRQQALDQEQRVAQHVADQMRVFIQARQDELFLLNTLGQQYFTSSPEISRGLMSLLSNRSMFYNQLSLTDSEGQELVRISTLNVYSVDDLIDWSQTEEFLMVKTDPQPYFSPLWFEPKSGEPMMTLIVPFIDMRVGQVKNVLIANLRFKVIWDLLNGFKTNGSEDIYIVNAEREVVAHRNPSVVLSRTLFDVPRQDGIHSGLNSQRAVIAAVDVQFGNQTLTVIAERPESEALSLAYDTLNVLLVMLAISAVITVIVGFIAVRQITRPVQELLTTVQAITDGNLSRQVEVKSRHEIGRLAQAFNLMADRVRKSVTDLEQTVEVRTAELRKTKERVETILNNSPDAMLFFSTDRKIMQVNPATVGLLGYRADELLDQTPVMVVDAAYLEKFCQAFDIALAQGRTQRLEVIVRRKDQSIVEVDTALAPVKEGGHVIAIVCALRDMAALKEVARMKDAFVSNVSHELRTPITSLKLYCDLLDANPAGLEKYVDRLRRESDRLDRIVENILRLSRLDQGRVKLQPVPVQLNHLAQQYVSDRTPLAESRHLSLNFVGHSDLPVVLADEGLIGQTVSVLLINALNYTQADGEIVVSTLVREMDGQQWAGIEVKDNGPGISLDDQKKLFERFFRGSVGRASKEAGTGLGLAIAKEIVDRHKGQIEIFSLGIAGEGSCFRVWLPARREEE